MYEPTHGRFSLVPRNWLQVLAYLALPIVLAGLGVVWPILRPPTRSSAIIDPAAYQALIDQWTEINVNQLTWTRPASIDAMVDIAR